MVNYEPEILRVNLTTGYVKREEVPTEVTANYVGGRGLGASYLYGEIDPGIDALSLENKIIFTVGPLAGTGALSYSRWMVTTKSPLTGGYLRSVAGADFGAWMSFAGLIGIVVEGKANTPAYLLIQRDRVEIREAGELWGMGTVRTQQRLKAIHGESSRVACIGIAGEKLVRFAQILSDQRSAGRGGAGTVMGSKNLKAIVIQARPALPEIPGLKDLIRQQADFIKKAPSSAVLRRDGTHMNMVPTQTKGVFPARNFRHGRLPDWERLSPKAYASIKVKDTSCYGCIVRCGKVFKAIEGPYAGAQSEGPDYETTFALAGSIATTDIGFTIAADALLDDLGMDSISTGVTIGFAYELFEKGILNIKDTDGLELSYGNCSAAMELIKRIALRQGIGDILAEGSRRAGLHIGKGAARYAMQVKGMELPGYEPRGLKRQGLAYATSNIGGSHNLAFIDQELHGTTMPHPVDRLADEGSADVVKIKQDAVAMQETGICCAFTRGMAPPAMFGEMLFAVTGIPELRDPACLSRVGERIWNLERLFNTREGFDRKDDALPLRMITEPLENAGPSEGEMVRKLDSLLDEYYDLRGWDRDGKPTPQKLKELGLCLPNGIRITRERTEGGLG